MFRSCASAVLAGFALALTLATSAAAERITVFAAASLSNALTEIEAAFEADTGHDVAIAFAGSSALARQIEQGAPADIFISASPDWMDRVEDAGLIEDGTRVDLLGNSIVLIAYGAADPVVIGPGFDLADLLGQGRLAMALVDAVPAGIYGKAALQSLGVWNAVEPQVAQADNVRAALAFVATGAAPYGIVYATDAVAEDDVTVIGTFPAGSHPPIVYPVAGINGRTGEAALAFLDYLRGETARDAFEAEGFVMVGE
ncbi:molybdate ABC transporter substrate-binding protein [Anianabacter salinae]|uniref:molybdate ABC transporter substrate-binding protein n=1 Tax=Anianabacter salinae TaxID=2851023 RepID=UPI00225E2A93|nr:molybdate ABC transporter substrate-binding protein [Anianabacter salinae]MBV0913705.1 molybdate ABC transporter substrate-binding protein [Anianabacter salinae]